MHSRSLAALFMIFGVSGRCFALPQNFGSSSLIDGAAQSPISATSSSSVYKPIFASSTIIVSPRVIRHPSDPSPPPPPPYLSSSLQEVGLSEPPSTRIPLFPARHPQRANNTIDTVTKSKGVIGATRHQSPERLVFGIIGGLLGVAILILTGKTLLSCYRTPRRDLATDHIDRYNLEKELREIEEARRHEHPPPAYQQAPQYEEVIKHTPSVEIIPVLRRA